jgi:hypothetical protein
MMHRHPPRNLTQKHQTEKEKSLNAIQCNHFTANPQKTQNPPPLQNGKDDVLKTAKERRRLCLQKEHLPPILP